MNLRQIHKNDTSFRVSENQDYWDSFESNSWEPSTFSILDKILLPNYTMVDIGAWIGPITLYSSFKVKKCYSFEPDPVAFKELQINVSSNPELLSKIVIINKAITEDGGVTELFSRYALGDSGSSLLKRIKSRNNFIEISSFKFEDFLKEYNIEKIDFIKMDIEGGEFKVLPQMINYLKKESPTLLISIHFNALCEFFELKYLRLGLLRRIYRFIDPNKSLLKRISNNQINKLIDSLSFYKIYQEDLSSFQPERKNKDFYQKIEMLLFTKLTF